LEAVIGGGNDTRSREKHGGFLSRFFGRDRHRGGRTRKLLFLILEQQEQIMADLSGLQAELEDLKTSSQAAFDAVLAAQATAADSLAALQAQIDELTAGAVTQEQIDALTATAQEADEDVDAIAAAVTPAPEPAPEPEPEPIP
jgi:chromosome segregation ATPase